MIRVAVIGKRMLGRILIRILQEHPEAEIVYKADSKKSKGNLSQADCVFLAIPHGQSRIFVAKHKNLLQDIKIIDLSADFRLKWVYGLPELNREAIRKASRVACPGCFPTGILLGLGPLIGKLSSTLLCIDAASGISGAGLKKRKKDNIVSYKAGHIHYHLPEIKKVSGATDIIFCPMRCDNTDFGILGYITIHGLEREKNITDVYRQFYSREPRVRIVNHDIQTADVIGTNYCDIKVQWECRNTLLITFALDNTLRGGASQTILNFNLMYGLPENMGLGKYS